MATPRMSDALAQQAIDMAAAHGGVGAASRAMGIPQATLQTRYRKGLERGLTPRVQKLLAGEQAAAPEGMGLKKVTTQVDEFGHPIKQWVGNTRMSEKVRDMEDPPKLLDGMMLKGVSTFYDGDGRKSAEWVLQRADALRQKEIQEAVVAELCSKITPMAPMVAPVNREADLATLYTMTDCHVGMLAWDKETGQDWDLGIAEQCLTETLLGMIDAAPASAVGILNQLGDFLHFDSLTPVTPAHHHILDADSRYQKVVVVAVRILRRVIDAMLCKHESVHVEMKEGNHDPTGSVWLRVMFAQLYSEEPRVSVNLSPNPYSIYVHGKTLLGFYHGHLAKLTSLAQIFAAQFRKEWGVSEHCYIHTGHKHHIEEKEYPGVLVVQHPTLAAPDAFAARGGWISKRQATSMTYSKVKGEIARGIFVPVTK